MPEWYVVWCQTGKELELMAHIRHIPKIQEAIVPVRPLAYRTGGKWEFKDSVLIPSYIFVRCKMDSLIYHTIKDTRAVLGWLGKDGYWPEIVPDEQMTPVIALDEGKIPEEVLLNVTIDKHKRRGHGELMLNGTTQRVVFTPEQYKQANETRVDECPADEDAEQSTGDMPKASG